MKSNPIAPCPVCGEKTLPATKDRPCALCGYTIDDPHGVLFDDNHSGAERMDFEQLMLVISDPAQAGNESPPSTPASWTRDEYVAFCKKRKLARAYANKTGETLFFDEIACSKCGNGRGKFVSRPNGSGIWRMVCSDCDEPLTNGAIEKAVGEIETLAAKETEFQAPDVPMVTLERALKDRAIEELRSDRKMMEVFPEKQLAAILDGSEIQSGDSDEKGRIKKTMKRLIESTGFRKLVAPGPAWQSQIDLISDLPQIRNTFNGSGLVVTSACSSLGSIAGRSKRRLKR